MSPRRVTTDDLEGWVLSSAHWRVVDVSDRRAPVDMCACTGEPLVRVQSANPAGIGYLRTGHPELGAG